MGKIIGIDLGTTNSCVAFMEGGEAKVIPNAEGNRTTPSIVAHKEGNIIVGTPAKRQAITNPAGTIFSAKRFIGRKFDEVKDEIASVPYEVVKGKDGSALIKFGDKEVRPEEIGAHVLMKLKEDAEKFLGSSVTEAVITVPAYFNDDQRQATINAGKIAGLEVKRIVNEPTAAALSYGAGKGKSEKIAVYDLGGGTFDISILELSEEGTFEVLSTNGDTHLGGDDFDKKLVDYIIDEFKKDQAIDLRNDPMALQRVRDEAEKAKKELSSTTEYDVNLPYITVDSSGPKNLLMTITRTKFEELIGDLVERSIEPCKKVLSDAGLNASDLNQVLLVGGSTRVPLVLSKVEAFFGKKPNAGINPDEAVALGAAIQAGIIGGDVTDVLLLDVTPLTLGIETMGGVRTPMIARNTTIPANKSEIFSTAVDNQPSVEIHILQGEREMAADNKSLGRFMLDGINPAPRGTPQIEVHFDIDANGILKVTAKDKATGKSQHITIQGSTGMDEAEVDRLVKEAEAKKEEDSKKKGLVDARNMADSSIVQANKMLDDNKDKIEEADKKLIEEKIAEVKKVLENTNATKEEIESATKPLSDEMMKVGQKLYSQPGAQEQAKGGEETKKDEDGVVDAEVETDDKNDKGNTTRV
ncbi:molecular chaperone DnaK [Candidatus Gracilibacteria bacterium]|nr:MAG: molecular chaperone DnaK [Candidatus Gracilibacteria bacterium]PIE85285.1 MAG: molecular chaperone DnaK [Candidatus Gracilibacteria bacterium]